MAWDVFSGVTVSNEWRGRPFRLNYTLPRRCGQPLYLRREIDQCREHPNWQRREPKSNISKAYARESRLFLRT